MATEPTWSLTRWEATSSTPAPGAWREGRLLVIGFSSGRIPEHRGEPHPPEDHISRRRRVAQLSNTRPAGAAVDAQEDIWAGYREGALRPVISRVLPLTGVVDALAAIEARRATGRS